MKQNNLKEKNGRNSCSIEPEKIVNEKMKQISNENKKEKNDPLLIKNPDLRIKKPNEILPPKKEKRDTKE